MAGLRCPWYRLLRNLNLNRIFVPVNQTNISDAQLRGLWNRRDREVLGSAPGTLSPPPNPCLWVYYAPSGFIIVELILILDDGPKKMMSGQGESI